MTKLREPGEVWHIGWDWYAHMWFVEPPFDIDLDEPIKWFHERDEAFDYVDDWIRRQPVAVSIVDQAEVNQEPVVAIPLEETVTVDIPYVPHSRESEILEPPRVLSDVHIPTPEEARTEQEQRIAEYNARVGIK